MEPNLDRLKNGTIGLHDAIIRELGGSYGIRDEGALESSLAQPYQSAMGQDLYPSDRDKAARVAYNIVKNHPFVDGNKRTGGAILPSLLEDYGYEFTPSEEEIDDTIESLAAGTIGYPQIQTWVRQRTVPCEPLCSKASVGSQRKTPGLSADELRNSLAKGAGKSVFGDVEVPEPLDTVEDDNSADKTKQFE